MEAKRPTEKRVSRQRKWHEGHLLDGWMDSKGTSCPKEGLTNKTLSALWLVPQLYAPHKCKKTSTLCEKKGVLIMEFLLVGVPFFPLRSRSNEEIWVRKSHCYGMVQEESIGVSGIVWKVCKIKWYISGSENGSLACTQNSQKHDTHPRIFSDYAQRSWSGAKQDSILCLIIERSEFYSKSR